MPAGPRKSQAPSLRSGWREQGLLKGAAELGRELLGLGALISILRRSCTLADHLLERLELRDRFALARRVEARVGRAEVEERDLLAGLVALAARLLRGLVLRDRLRRVLLAIVDVAEEAVDDE